MRVSAGRSLHTLCFDIENRPLSYWVPDRPSAEVTAIAAAWTDSDLPTFVWLLGLDSMEEMLLGFKALYDEAEMVTGHYIRRHDLPILNGALIEVGLPTLGQKLTQDTKLDLVKRADLPVSQEALAEMLGVPAPKFSMSQPKWREANRLTREGLALTEKRVKGDVLQHMLMRKELLKRGLLKQPKVWRP